MTQPQDTGAHARDAALESARIRAEQGDAGAQGLLAQAYYLGEGVAQDYVEAVRRARLAAEQGDARGQSVLAAAYNSANGVAADYGEAVRWARLAAEQGDARGQFVLASLYRGGRGGVAQDYVESVRWARLAADQGYADAWGFLGMMYLAGEGVEQDFVSAYMWLSLADASWAEPRDRLDSILTAEQIAEAEERAAQLVK